MGKNEKRFKVRHKPTGKFLAGRTAFDLSPTGQLFTSKQKVLQSLESRADYKLPLAEELELVEYELVEVKIHPLRLKNVGNASHGSIWVVSRDGTRRL